MSISDYRHVALISVNKWQELYYPPHKEIYLIKELMAYSLLFSRTSSIGHSIFHKQTRSCLFDFYGYKPELHAGLRGHTCPECTGKLKNSGIKSSHLNHATQIVEESYRNSTLIRSESERQRCFISHDSRDKEALLHE